MTIDSAVFSHASPLLGSVSVPGDKSISHRALLFAGLAEGTSSVRGLSDGDDVVRTRLALAALGIVFAGDEVCGGRRHLREPERPLDLGNSGTAIRLLSGVLAAFGFLTILIGDESIHRRPMDRIADPLRAMGAHIDGRDGGRFAPIVIRGGALRGIDYSPPVASAQVKSAVLLAGLGSSGTTVVREAIPTRRHTEEMLALAGAPATITEQDGKIAVSVTAAELSPFEIDVPGDPSQATFLVVAATLVPNSNITVKNVYVGPGRAGFITVLRRMGADIELVHHDAVTADVHVRAAVLRATTVQGSEIADLIDEIPVLAVAAAFASGETTFRDAGELRVKESDRIATICQGLMDIGGRAEPLPDGLVVHGVEPRTGGVVETFDDHRIAMAFAIAGLVAEHPVTINGFSAVATSWPGFVSVLTELQCQ